jgi:hypothetical protein
VIVRRALSILAAVLGPGTLLLVGVVVFLALIPTSEPDPDARAQSTPTGWAVVSDDGKTVRLALKVRAGATSTRLVIESADGPELATCVFYQDGAFTFESNGDDPLRFVGVRSPSGLITLGAADARSRFTITSAPDGSAELIVRDATDEYVSRVRLGAETRAGTD